MPDELKVLQRLFAEAVLVVGPYAGDELTTGWPVKALTHGLMAVTPECWFRSHSPGIDACAGGRPGVLEAAHWIKRQRVEKMVKAMLYGATTAELLPNGLGTYDALLHPVEIEALYVPLAAWDPRNAVPACEHHHRRFDGHKVPRPSEQLIVPRHLVPRHVVEFTENWGLETALEDKHPLEV